MLKSRVYGRIFTFFKKNNRRAPKIVSEYEAGACLQFLRYESARYTVKVATNKEKKPTNTQLPWPCLVNQHMIILFHIHNESLVSLIGKFPNLEKNDLLDFLRLTTVTEFHCLIKPGVQTLHDVVKESREH